MSLHVIILAAGVGTRMRSNTPKVLHKLAGKALLQHVIDAAAALNPEQIHVVIGHGATMIQAALPDAHVHWVIQAEQKGTGHAVHQVLPHLPEEAEVLVLSADVPLIQPEQLQPLITAANHSPDSTNTSLRLLLGLVPNPTGLGRIERDEAGCIQRIVEEKDADATQKQIREIYSGICCANARDLARWLPQLTATNAQKEYYLTDLVTIAVAEQKTVLGLRTSDPLGITGVNSRMQLMELERAWQHRRATQLLESGVSLADLNRVDIRGTLECGTDVFIDINAVFTGHVVIGNGCIIGPNCTFNNVTLADNCHIQANSVLDGCSIGAQCNIGPFARIRPGTVLGAKCSIGNFVETKQAVFDSGSKASHLSYLGDVTVGKRVNIGAGTITCNYDGAHKHQTIIEDDAFIGSDTQLVAPVTVGKNATIGAGTTLRKSAPANQLTLTISTQKSIANWKRPHKTIK